MSSLPSGRRSDVDRTAEKERDRVTVPKPTLVGEGKYPKASE